MQICWLKVPDAPVAAAVLHNTTAHQPSIVCSLNLQEQAPQRHPVNYSV
jgi:hypothetical protein